MLLRLHVKGFKNLRDVEVRFGPITCFVGHNGAGKSNLFDALHFLRLLADNEIPTAAARVRTPSSGSFGPRDLFWDASPERAMSFEADMLVPGVVVDDFGRPATPTATFLRYEVAFRYSEVPLPRLELTSESLTNLKLSAAKEQIGFPHHPSFRTSVIGSARRGGPLISTKTANDGTVEVLLHQDGGSRGRPIPAGRSPRTVLGGTNAAEYPTVLAARREMASWHTLHLEPSAMRAPDPFGATPGVDEHGAHIAASLLRLTAGDATPERALTEAANRLSTLVPEIESLRVDRDEARQQLVLLARLRGCAQELSARSLSDGTLRFLALVTMQLDPTHSTVLCMEEPENGIHPSKVPDMIQLLRDFSVDPELPAGGDNPLRQVILNTHSPDVARQLLVEEILFVEAIDGPDGRHARVRPVLGTWRGNEDAISSERLVDFLGGAPIGLKLKKQIDLPFSIGTAE
jgi:predicted ATPase